MYKEYFKLLIKRTQVLEIVGYGSIGDPDTRALYNDSSCPLAYEYIQ